MTDLRQRLRAADPCPAPVAYDSAVAQRNIDAIVRTDLTVRPVVPVPRRRPRAWFAVAALAVVLAVVGTVVGVEISRDGTTPSAVDGPWETFSSNGVSFEHPRVDELPAGVRVHDVQRHRPAQHRAFPTGLHDDHGSGRHRDDGVPRSRAGPQGWRYPRRLDQPRVPRMGPGAGAGCRRFDRWPSGTHRPERHRDGVRGNGSGQLGPGRDRHPSSTG